MREHLRALRVLVGLPFRIDRARTTIGLVLLFTSQLGSVVLAWAFKLGTDAVVGHNRDQLVLALGVIIAAIGLSDAGSWASFTIRAALTERTSLAIDSELAARSGGVVGIEHHERPDYLDRLELLRQQRQNLVLVPDMVAWSASSLIRLAATSVLLGRVAPVLLLLPVFAVPWLWTSWRSARRMTATWDKMSPRFRMQGALMHLADDEAAGREARVFGVGPEIARRFNTELAEADRLVWRAQSRSTLETTASLVVFGAAFSGALIFLAQRVIHHQASAGDLVLAATLGSQINTQLSMFISQVNGLLLSLRTAERFLWLIDYSSTAAAPAEPVAAPNELRQGIRFEGVSFRYPGTDVDVLQDVDLALPAGATVGLVGDNGAGKTTIVKLLTRMYEPTTGRITVDGIDVATIDAGDWRARTSAGFQDSAKLEFTAQNVVGVGLLAARDDPEMVLAALDAAHARDVLASMPDGLRTQLGRQFASGVELSGGQWQKLGIGRAMMRDEPLLLVLDEPTAALDAPTEAALFERYAGAARRAAIRAGGITVLVSHRFSTVRMADVVVVVSGGRVVEVGSHDQLMAAGGLYAELYNLQARSYQ